MPFKKIGEDRYRSPSGRHFTGSQVRLYYAHGGKFPGQQGAAQGGSMEGVKMTKGSPPRQASYAEGGAVLGREKDFMKMKDEFRDPDEADAKADEDQKYGKSGIGMGDGAGEGEVKPPKAKPDKKIK